MKQSMPSLAVRWIASRSLSSGRASRGPVGSQRRVWERQCAKWFAEPCLIFPASSSRRYSQILLPRSFS
jgi:hypothetical protein